MEACDHLALAVPGRDFVTRCIDAARAHRQWQRLCDMVHQKRSSMKNWTPDCEDFTWLETSFCEIFLKKLRWFGGIDHEWRTGGCLERGGFYVLLWSKSPQRLWWELSDQVDREADAVHQDNSRLTGPGVSSPTVSRQQLTLGHHPRMR